MPMKDEQRRAYLKRAGVTQEQIDQTVGELPLHKGSYQARGLSRERAEQVRGAIRQVIADAVIIAAKYSAVAKSGAADKPGADELASDRGQLEELFAGEYLLHNPYGAVEDREHIIEAILKGMISYEGLGSRGFAANNQSLQVHGDVVVASGNYELRASSRAKDAETGELYRQDLGGNYRITNTYVHRDGRWQTTVSQMTTVPAQQKFTLTPDE